MNNNERYDISGRLIHFFRDVKEIDLEILPSFIENPQKLKDQEKGAFFFLEETIKHKLLPSTWSKRKNSGNCIYGNNPAICFTEMPLPAFIETVEYRKTKNEKISIHGLIFKKNDLYKLGARPVIYGLAKGNVRNISQKDDEKKCLDENNLPEKELYRYVSYNPFDENNENGVDFTHEREWRLPIIVDDDIEENSDFYSCKQTEGSINSLPNLRITRKYVDDVGIIVETESESSDILKILKEIYCENKELCPYTYIIVKNNITDTKNLRDFQKLEQFLKDAKANFKKNFFGVN